MTLYSVPDRDEHDPEEGSPGTSPELRSTAQTHAPARSIRPPAPSTSPAEAVAAPEFGAWLTGAVEWLTGVLDKPGTLLHAGPPSFRQAHARHVECASHHQWAVARSGRLLFGYIHLACVKPALNYLEWATDSPLRLTIHVLLGVAVWLTLLLGGYL
jgi:hypothetical protein